MTTATDPVRSDGERWLVYMPVDDLRLHPDNPKGHEIPTLEESMERFGYTEPPSLCERTGYLGAGHGRVLAVRAARDAGKPPPEGVVVDETGRWLMPVVRGWRSENDDELRFYLVTSNRTSEIGGWEDPKGLGAILRAASESERGLLGIGYDNAQVVDFLAGMNEPNFQPTAEPVPRLDQRDPFECPNCHIQIRIGADGKAETVTDG